MQHTADKNRIHSDIWGKCWDSNDTQKVFLGIHTSQKSGEYQRGRPESPLLLLASEGAMDSFPKVFPSLSSYHQQGMRRRGHERGVPRDTHGWQGEGDGGRVLPHFSKPCSGLGLNGLTLSLLIAASFHPTVAPTGGNG